MGITTDQEEGQPGSEPMEGSAGRVGSRGEGRRTRTNVMAAPARRTSSGWSTLTSARSRRGGPNTTTEQSTPSGRRGEGSGGRRNDRS
jgi:hypothetical protein